MNFFGRDHALEVRGLLRRGKKDALESVYFSLPYGKIMALTGKPASGKTLTLELLLGLKRRSAGSIRIFGADPDRLGSALFGEIGVVLSREAIPSSLRLGELSHVMKGIYHRWSEQTFMQLAHRFTLPDSIATSRYSQTLRAKLALAVAMSHGARLLVLDDPTRGLDAVDRDELLEVILDFVKDSNGSVLIATGELDVTEKIADSVTIMHEGKALLSGEVDRLCNEYAILTLPHEKLPELDGSLLVRVRNKENEVCALVNRADFKDSEFELAPAGIRDVLDFCVGEEEEQ